MIKKANQTTSNRFNRIKSVKHLPAGDGDCFKFWFNMHGSTSDSLNVVVQFESHNWSTVWSRSGNLGNTWRYGYTSIKSSKSDANFQVAFEGDYYKLKIYIF